MFPQSRGKTVEIMCTLHGFTFRKAVTRMHEDFIWLSRFCLTVDKLADWPVSNEDKRQVEFDTNNSIVKTSWMLEDWTICDSPSANKRSDII